MKIRFWNRRPAGVPRRAFALSAAYQKARLDLDAATATEDRWSDLLLDRRAAILVSPDECTEKIMEARAAQIDALWRLGWDKTARERQADLDMRLGWMAERKAQK